MKTKQSAITLLVIFSLFTTSFALATKSNTKIKDIKANDTKNYIKIGHIPPRGLFMKGQPYTELISETRTPIPELKSFYEKMNSIKKKGITTNQREFHVAMKFIEVSFEGQQVRLSYTTPSNLAKFKAYEEQWFKLHKDVYGYLTKNLQVK